MRKAGILMAVSSLPNNHGVGDFGPTAKKFVDLIKKAGFKLWQVLPLNPLGYGHSPYQPFSSNAMDELYISLELLVKKKYLDKVPNYLANSKRVEYERVRIFKQRHLMKAFRNFMKVDKEKLVKFEKSNAWVRNYAEFMALKKQNGMIAWNLWSKEEQDYINDHKYSMKHLKSKVNYEIFLQYILLQQWNDLRKYANKNGIQLIGDIPFYVGFDSVDVWANQQYFELDEFKAPKLIAGVPPDYFSATGQRWGNPIYKWNKLQSDNFEFLVNRFGYTANLFDIIRIDHFRAFDSYYEIDAKYPTAEIGEWKYPPGYAFFDTLFEKMPNIEIIAEDLGDLRPEVLVLRDHYNFPGMKIIQFTFESEEVNGGNKDTSENMVSYISTHDNLTLKQWYDTSSDDLKGKMYYSLKDKGYNDMIYDNFIAYTFDGECKYAIIMMQDLLGLDEYYRMNKPGIIDDENWTFRLKNYDSFETKIPYIKMLIEKSSR